MRSIATCLLILSACVSSDAVTCADGKLCPADTKCVALTNPNPAAKNPNPEFCATPQQLSVCDGVADGAMCTDGTGTCYGGFCISPPGCGNGWLDPNEVCDDGNQTSGDGCSADCKSLEVCGNSIVDAVKSEQCDDGNLISHDSCDSHCQQESPLWTQIGIDAGGTSTAAPDPRRSPAMVFDPFRERMLLFGGTSQDGSFPADTWSWNGYGWTLAGALSEPTGRSGAGIAYDVAHHQIVMFGGLAAHGAVLGDTELFDGTRWRRAPGVGPARSGAAMAYDSKRQRVVLFGGAKGVGGEVVGSGVTANDETWEWDGTAWTEMAPPHSPDKREGVSMAFDPVRGKIVLFGGADGSLGEIGDNAVYEYDGTDWTRIAAAGGPSSRTGAGMAWDPVHHAVMVFGGDDGTGNPVSDTWEWNGTAWSFYSAGPPTQQSSFAMATDWTRGRIVFFGSASDDKTWEWDGFTWSDVSPASVTIDVDSELAYDWLRGRAVFVDTSYVTWETDGEAWYGGTASLSSQRYRVAIAYDEDVNKVFAFGGVALNVPGAYAITSSWSGTAWTDLAPASSPTARETTMTYDAARKQIVLFGGTPDPNPSAGSVMYLNDTWLFDGTTWTQAHPAHQPPARYLHHMAYDRIRQNVVLFGGLDAGGERVDLWLWDGTDWTQSSPAVSPPSSIRASELVWWGSRRVLATVLGNSDTWTWDGSQWTLVPAEGLPIARSEAAVLPSHDGGAIVLSGGSYFPPLQRGVPIADSWRLRWEGPDPDEACVTPIDLDGDGKTACADPDCWATCAPLCPPGTSCELMGKTCGNGTCDPRESCRTCAMDCGACTAVCGDGFCDAPETAATCPGDCP